MRGFFAALRMTVFLLGAYRRAGDGNSKGKDEIRGSLHCAANDETVLCFGRDDSVLVGRLQTKQRQICADHNKEQATARTKTKADPYGMTTKEQATATTTATAKASAYSTGNSNGKSKGSVGSAAACSAVWRLELDGGGIDGGVWDF